MKTKFVLNWVCLFALLFASVAWSDVRSLEGNSTDGFYINMPSVGDDVLTITEADVAAGATTFTVYDDGGADENYSEYILHSCLSLVSPVGYRLQMSGTRDLENDDNLWIHDGSVSETKLLDKISGSGDFGPVTSTGNTVTVCFESDILWSFTGFALTVTLVESPETHNISVIENVEHGSVELGATSAQVGYVVDLSFTPDNGYYLKGFSLQDEEEKVLYTYDAWYRDVAPSFAMPYADVSVVPVFVNGLTAENGLYITTPYNGIDKYSIPENVVSFHIYDDGGASEGPTEGASGSVELTAPENYRWVLTGNLATHDYSDGLSVYDGAFSSSYLVHNLHSSEYGVSFAIDTLVSSGRVMTVRFQTYTYGKGGFGLDLIAKLIDARPHSITVVSSDLGEIRCDGSATYGTEVTFWAVPEAGAELVSISAVDSDNKPVPLTRGGGLNSNRFTFAMREKPVTITPVFANENVVTFDENGCLTNGTYFHLECPTEDIPVCYLSQKVVENPNEGVTDFKCFYSTSENTRGVVNAFNDRRNVKLNLLTDLNLGGYVDGRCAMSAFAPFDLTNAIEKDFNGNNHTVKGFCYEGDAQRMGFVLNANVYNVTFDSAHVVANNATNGSQAGVVAWYGDNLTRRVSNVNVENSYVSGTQAGAIAGSSAINNGVLVIQNAHVTNSEIHALPPAEQVVTISAAGGLVGFAHNLEITSAYLTNVNVTGGAKMGGAVGYIDATAYDIESPSKAEFYNVMFNGSVGKSCSENSSIGGLVGEYGNPSVYAKLIIERSMLKSVNATPLVYEESCSGVTLQNANVGGIVGSVSDGSIQMELSIQNTATIGDIAVSGVAASSVGYIAGAISVGAENTSANVYYNYHYGNDAVALGVGNFDYQDSGSELNTIDNWKKGYNVNYCYFSENVRNGSSKNSLETDGPIGPHEYLVYQAEGYFRYMFKLKVDENGVFSSIVANGVASDEDMKSGKFAAALNYSSGAGEWTWLENLNDGLPIIGSSTGRPAYYLYLSIYDYGTDGTGLYLPTLDTAKLGVLGLDTISWGVDHSNNVVFSQYGVAGYTDAEGHANAEFLKHYQDIVSDIDSTNTVTSSLTGYTSTGEYRSRVFPITDTIRQVLFCKFMHKKQIFPFPSRLSKFFLPSIPRVVPSVASR